MGSRAPSIFGGRRRRFFLGALVACGFVLAAVGLAYATVPGGDGTISGCYRSHGGVLRVIDAEAGATCAKNELPLSWNREGPKGDPGPPGPPGPPGRPGPPGAPLFARVSTPVVGSPCQTNDCDDDPRQTFLTISGVGDVIAAHCHTSVAPGLDPPLVESGHMAFRNTSSEEEIVSTLGGQARLAPGADTLFTGPNIADVVRYPVTSETAAEPPSMVSIWSESHLVTAFASGAIRGADPNAVCDFAIQVFVSP